MHNLLFKHGKTVEMQRTRTRIGMKRLFSARFTFTYVLEINIINQFVFYDSGEFKMLSEFAGMNNVYRV
jgi:hypothetical protein